MKACLSPARNCTPPRGSTVSPDLSLAARYTPPPQITPRFSKFLLLTRYPGAKSETAKRYAAEFRHRKKPSFFSEWVLNDCSSANMTRTAAFLWDAHLPAREKQSFTALPLK